LLHSADDYQKTLIDAILAGAINQSQHYGPRGRCAGLLGSTEAEVVISGPAGTGKSRACLEKLNFCAFQYPAMRGLILRKVRSDLSESGLVTFERDVLGLDHSMVVDGPRRNYRQIYQYDNGSEIVVGGLDKPGKALSSEYDLIYVQQAEETQEEDWETLTTRLRNNVMPFQQLMACCNPDRPTHWLKQRCEVGRAEMLESQHEDNPRLWDAQTEGWTEEGQEYIARLDGLTGARKQRLRYGRWVQAEGVVFESYDAAIHLIDRFEIPEDWRRIRVVDFGYVGPFVCSWYAIDGDGRMFRYREIYHTKRLVSEHGKQINELSQGEKIEATICDHDAEDMATLRAAGIRTQPADKAVSVGLQKVEERLQVQPDGRARLYFLRGSLVERDRALVEAKKPTCTEQEFDGYVWSDKARKEQPVKEDDHGMDLTRYAAMYTDKPKRAYFG